MDWLRFELCAFIWILYLTNSQSQLIDTKGVTCVDGAPSLSPDGCNTCKCINNTMVCTSSPCDKPSSEECIEGEVIPSTDECVQCDCIAGMKVCKRTCHDSEHNHTTQHFVDCVEGEHIPSPADCIECACQGGKKECWVSACTSTDDTKETSESSVEPRLATECVDGEPIPSPAECIECTCQGGKKECSIICKARERDTREISEFSIEQQSNRECVDGEPIPPPAECIECTCQGGKKECWKTCTPTANDMKGIPNLEPEACVEGEIFPSSEECVRCECTAGKKVCTRSCFVTEHDHTEPQSPDCVDGDPVPSSSECIECACQGGKKECWEICPPTMDPNGIFPNLEPEECEDGEPIPPPAECMECACRRGKKECWETCTPTENDMNEKSESNLEPQLEKECTEGELLPSSEECVECRCNAGMRVCTRTCHETEHNTNTTPQTNDCVDGEPIPSPAECIECTCQGGKMECWKTCTPSGYVEKRIREPNLEPRLEKECTEGEDLPSSEDCVQCRCITGTKVCTRTCPDIEHDHTTPQTLECVDREPIPPPAECIECACQGGKMECWETCTPPGNDEKGIIPPNLEPRLEKECTEGEELSSSEECVQCRCVTGIKVCTRTCPDTEYNHTTPQTLECVDGKPIPPPAECIECACQGGKMKCWETCTPTANDGKKIPQSYLEPQLWNDCVDGEPIPPPAECIECTCQGGKIECWKTCSPSGNVEKGIREPNLEPRLEKECTEGEELPSSEECVQCRCVTGIKVCKRTCTDTEHNHTTPQTLECVDGEPIPPPAECIECACQGGKMECWETCTPTANGGKEIPQSYLEPQLWNDCMDGEPIPPPAECIECTCQRGKIECWETCTPSENGEKGIKKPNLEPHLEKECTEGEELPSSEECIQCRCVTGIKVCTRTCPDTEPNHTIPQTLECVDGEPIPPPAECIECACQKGKMECWETCTPTVNDGKEIPQSYLEPQLEKECTEGEVLPSSEECVECRCNAGMRVCTRTCLETEHNTTPQINDCVDGEPIPPPAKCIECICSGGKTECWETCTPTENNEKGILEPNLEPRLEKECTEGDIFPSSEECIQCSCVAGMKVCTRTCLETELGYTSPQTLECVDGVAIPPPAECIQCKCQGGKKECWETCTPTENNEKEITGINLEPQLIKKDCVDGELLPPPTECIQCICRGGKTECWQTCMPTKNDKKKIAEPNLEPRLGKDCVDGQPIPPPAECIECACQDGKTECWQTCTPTENDEKGIREPNLEPRLEKDCVEGEPVLPPAECIECACQGGKTECWETCTRTDNVEKEIPQSFLEPQLENDCVDGESIPPPAECIKCACQAGRKECWEECTPTENEEKELSEINLKPQLETECVDGEPVPSPADCIECACQGGKTECWETCTRTENNEKEIPQTNLEPPLKKDCVDGEFISSPAECIECACQGGKKECRETCTPTENNEKELTGINLEPQLEKDCVDGEPVPPPAECIECVCRGGKIECWETCTPIENETTETNLEPRLQKDCVDGETIPSPAECIECACKRGKKECWETCTPTDNNEKEITGINLEPQSVKDCVDGKPIPPPAECIECACQGSKMECWETCTPTDIKEITGINLEPQLEKECVDGEPIPHPAECIQCACSRGKTECWETCTPTENDEKETTETYLAPRLEEDCVDGEPIPPPAECIECVCQGGKRECWETCTPTDNETTETYLEPRLEDCVDGETIPPPTECIECACQGGKKECWKTCTQTGNDENEIPETSLATQFERECMEGEVFPSSEECVQCDCIAGKKICTKTCLEPEDNNTTPHNIDCVEGEPIFPPAECIQCTCQGGKKECWDTCTPTENNKEMPDSSVVNPQLEIECSEGEVYEFPEECAQRSGGEGMQMCARACFLPKHKGTTPKTIDCVDGEPIPPPAECMECACQGGKKQCWDTCTIENDKKGNTESSLESRLKTGDECVDGQAVLKPDECNECYCFDGRLECSNLVCIRTRGSHSECHEGQSIPEPDACNKCICVEGHILCTNSPCNSKPELSNHGEEISGINQLIPDELCDGDYIPPPPPPDDCNKCLCINHRIYCTRKACSDSQSSVDIKSRLLPAINEQNYFESMNKPILLERFINTFYQDYDKKLMKLIHTHAYNGYHQEIKVHSEIYPQHASRLIKALANSLDNPALANILKLSEANKTLDLPMEQISDGKMIPKNSLASSEFQVLQAQSSIITSGAFSNVTILVTPNSGSQNDKNKKIFLLPSSPKEQTNHETMKSNKTEQAELSLQDTTQSFTESNSLSGRLSDNAASTIPSNKAISLNNNKINQVTEGLINVLPLNHKPFFSNIESYTDDVITLNSYEAIDPTHKYLHNSQAQFQPKLTMFDPNLLHPPQNDSTPGYKPSLVPKSDNRFFIPNLIMNPEILHSNIFPSPHQFLNPGQNLPHFPFLPNLTSLNINNFPDLISNNGKSQPHSTITFTTQQYNPPQTGFQTDQNVPTNTITTYVTHFPQGTAQNQTRTIINNGGPQHASLTFIKEFGSPKTELLPNQDNEFDIVIQKANKYLHLNSIPSQYTLIKNNNQNNNPQLNNNQFNPQFKIDSSLPVHTQIQLSQHPLVENVLDNRGSADGFLYTSGLPDGHNGIKGNQYLAPKLQINRPKTHPIGVQYNEDLNSPESIENILILSGSAEGHDQSAVNHLTLLQSQSSSEEDLVDNEVINFWRPQLPFENHPIDAHKPHQLQFQSHQPPLQNHPNKEVFDGLIRPEKILNQYKPLHSQIHPIQPQNNYSPNYPKTGIQFLETLDSHESNEVLKYLPGASKDHNAPVINNYTPQSQINIDLSHPDLGDFDDRGSMDGFQSISNFNKEPNTIKFNQQKPHKLQFSHQIPIPQNNPNADSSEGHNGPTFNLLTPFQPKNKPLYHKIIPSQPLNIHLPYRPNTGIQYLEVLDSQESNEVLQYLPGAAKGQNGPTVNQYIPFQPQINAHQNNPDSGVFDDQHTSNSNEDYKIIKSTHQKPYRLQLQPTQLPVLQHNPNKGTFDSAKGHYELTLNQYKPSQFLNQPPQLQNKSPQPTINPSQPLNTLSPYGPDTGIQYLEVLDSNESNEVFQYLPGAAKGHNGTAVNTPLQPQIKVHQNYPYAGVDEFQQTSKEYNIININQQKPRQLQFQLHQPPIPKYNLNTGVLDDRGSVGGFEFIFDSDEDVIDHKINHYLKLLPILQKTPSHFYTDIFDDQTSAGGFELIFNSDEDLIDSEVDHYSHFLPQIKEPLNHLKGVKDSLSGEINNMPNYYGPYLDDIVKRYLLLIPQLQKLPNYPNIFGDSQEVLSLPNSLEDILGNKINHYLHLIPQFKISPNYTNPGILGDRGFKDSLQYLPGNIKIPNELSFNQHEPSQLQLKPLQTQMIYLPNNPRPGVQYKEIANSHESMEIFQYLPNAADGHNVPTVNHHILPQLQFKSPQLQISPPNHPIIGVFDDRKPADGFQYISNSNEELLNIKFNQYKPPILNHQSSKPQQNRPFQQKIKPLQPQIKYLPNNPRPSVQILDSLESIEMFQYLPGTADDRYGPGVNQYNTKPIQKMPLQQQPLQHEKKPYQLQNIPPKHQFKPYQPQNKSPQHQNEPAYLQSKPSQHLKEPFQPHNIHPLNHPKTKFQHLPFLESHESNEVFQYLPGSAKHYNGPTVNKYTLFPPIIKGQQKYPNSGVFDARGSADGFQYVSNSNEETNTFELNPQLPHQYKIDHTQPPITQPKPLQHQKEPYPLQYIPPQKQNGPYQPLQHPNAPYQPQNIPLQHQNEPYRPPNKPTQHPNEPQQPQSIPSQYQNEPFQHQNYHQPSHPNKKFQYLEILDSHESNEVFEYLQGAANHHNGPAVNKYTPLLPKIYSQEKYPNSGVGVFDDRGSADGFQYVLNSNEEAKTKEFNPQRPQEYKVDYTQPPIIQTNPLIHQNQPFPLQYIPPQKQNGPYHPLQYPNAPYKPQNIPLQHQNEPYRPPNKPTQHPNEPQQPQNKPLQHQNKPLQPQNIYVPNHPNTELQYLEILNSQESNEVFQYQPGAAKHLIGPAINKFTPPKPKLNGQQNYPHLGVFDDRGSADGFQYVLNSNEEAKTKEFNPQRPQEYKVDYSQPPIIQTKPLTHQNQPFPLQYIPPQKQNGPYQLLQYPNAPYQPQNIPLQHQNEPYQPPNKPTQHPNEPQRPQNKPLQHQYKPFQPQNIYVPNHPNTELQYLEILNSQESNEVFQYQPGAAKSLIGPAINKFTPPKPKLNGQQNYPHLGIFDDRGSVDGFQYVLNSNEEAKTKEFNPQRPQEYKVDYTQPPIIQTNPLIHQNQPFPLQYIPPQKQNGPYHPLQYPNAPYKPQNIPLQHQNEPYRPPNKPTQHPNEPQQPQNKPLQHQNKPLQPQNIYVPNHPNTELQYLEILNSQESNEVFQYQPGAAKHLIGPAINKFTPPKPKLNGQQNYPHLGVFDDRGSADGFQYVLNSNEEAKTKEFNPQRPQEYKVDYSQPPIIQTKPLTHQNQPFPLQYIPPQKQNGPYQLLQYPNAPYQPQNIPLQHQNEPYQPPNKPTQHPNEPQRPQNKPLQHQYKPFQPQNIYVPNHPNTELQYLEILNSQESNEVFQYQPGAAKHLIGPAINKFTPPKPKLNGQQNYPHLGVFDDRGSADGFQYILNSNEEPNNIKLNQQRPHKYQINNTQPPMTKNKPLQPSPFLPQYIPLQDNNEPYQPQNKPPRHPDEPHQIRNTPLQHQNEPFRPPPPHHPSTELQYLEMFDSHESNEIFQYRPPKFKIIDQQNNPHLSVFDDRGSTDGFQYISNSNEELHNIKLDQQRPHKFRHPQPPMTQNKPFQSQNIYVPNHPNTELQYLEILNSQESNEVFQYQPGAAKHLIGPAINKFTPPKPKLNGQQNYPHLGVFDDRGSADGFQYILNSNEEPNNIKLNQQRPHKYQINNTQPPMTKNKPLKPSPFLPQYIPLQDNNEPYQPQNKPPRHPDEPHQIRNTPLQHQNEPFRPPPPHHPNTESQYLEMFDSHESNEIFQYRPPKFKIIDQQNNPHLSVFDDRGSTDGFQYISNSNEELYNIKLDQQRPHKFRHPQPPMTQNKPFQSQNIYVPNHPNTELQYLEILNSQESNEVFQYQPGAAKHLIGPAINKFTPPKPKLNGQQNYPHLGVFDDRGSADGFQYILNSNEEPNNIKLNQQRPHKYQINNTQPPMTKNKPLQPSPFLPQYIPLQDNNEPYQPQNKPPRHPDEPHQIRNTPLQHQNEPFRPPPPHHPNTESQYLEMFDSHESNEIFQYRPPKFKIIDQQNNPHLSVFDDRGSTDGFQYISNSNEELHNIKLDQQRPHKFRHPQPPMTQNKPFQSQNIYVPNHPNTELQYLEILNSQESNEVFKYQPGAAKHLIGPAINKFTPPKSKINGQQNYPHLGVFDDRGSADGFQYISNSNEEPNNIKLNQLRPHKYQINNTQPPMTKNKPFQPSPFLPQYIPHQDNNEPYQTQNKPPLHSDELHQIRNIPLQHQNEPFRPQPPPQPPMTQNKPDQPQNKPLKHQNEPFQPQNMYLPNHPNTDLQYLEILNSQESNEVFQYLPGSAKHHNGPAINKFTPPQPKIYGPHNYSDTKVFGDRGSANGFQYISNSNEEPNTIKFNKQRPHQYQIHHTQLPMTENKPIQHQKEPFQQQHIPPQHQNELFQPQNIHPPNHSNTELQYREILNSHESNEILQYLPFKPKINGLQNYSHSAVFDDRGSPDGFQYISNSNEEPNNIKLNQQKPLQFRHHQTPMPQTKPFLYQNEPYQLENKPSQYQNEPHLLQNKTPQHHQNEPYQPQNKPLQHHNEPSQLQKKPHNPLNQSPQYQNNVPQLQIINHHLPIINHHQNYLNPEVDGFQFISNSKEEYDSIEVNQQTPHQLQFQLQEAFEPKNHLNTGGFDDRKPLGGSEFIFDSYEDVIGHKVNDYLKRLPILQKTPNHQTSAGEYELIFNSDENVIDSEVNQYLHMLPQIKKLPNHPKGLYKGFADNINVIPNYYELDLDDKVKRYLLLIPQLQELPNYPNIFDSEFREVPFLPNSFENILDRKVNHYLPKIKKSPNNTNIGILNDGRLINGLQFLPGNVEGPNVFSFNLHKPGQLQLKPLQPQISVLPNNNRPGVQYHEISGSHESMEIFQYLPSAAENHDEPGVNKFRPLQHLNNQHQNKQNKHSQTPFYPRIPNGRKPADKYQYTSNSIEKPKTIQQKHSPLQFHAPQPPIKPTEPPEVFDDRGSADEFQYIPNHIEEPSSIFFNQYKPPPLLIKPQLLSVPQKQTETGVFDDIYIFDSLEESNINRFNKFTQPLLQLQPPQITKPQDHPNVNISTGVFDDRGAVDGFQYMSLPTKEPDNIQIEPHKPLQLQFQPLQPQIHKDRPSSGIPDERRPVLDILPFTPKYAKESNPYTNEFDQHIPPLFQIRPSQPPVSQDHIKTVFDERRPADRFKYISNQLIPSQPQFKPVQPQNHPHPNNLGDFGDHGSTNGIGYIPTYHEVPNNILFNKYKPNTGVNYQEILDSHESLEVFQYLPGASQSHNGPAVNHYKPLQLQVKPSRPQNYLPAKNPNTGDLDKSRPDSIIYNQYKPPLLQFQPPQAYYSQHHPPSSPGVLDDRGSADGFQYINNLPEETNSFEFEKNRSELQFQPPQAHLLQNYPSSNTDVFHDRGMPNKFPYILNSGEIPNFQLKELAPNSVTKPTIEQTTILKTIEKKRKPYRGRPHQMQHEKLPGQFSELPSSDEKLFSGFHEVPFSFPQKHYKTPSQHTFLPDNHLYHFSSPEIILESHNHPLPNKNISPNDDQHKKQTTDSKGVLNTFNWLKPNKENPPAETISWLMNNQNPYPQNVAYNHNFNPVPKEVILGYPKTTISEASIESTNFHRNISQYLLAPKLIKENRLQFPSPNHELIQNLNGKIQNSYSSESIETGVINIFKDVIEEGFRSPLLMKLNRFRFRPKDQKEECGEGTTWIRNCHGCSCQLGRAVCYRIPDCILQPLGEPMMCKPYSVFKMGDCYSCECNGDGVAECDATECKTELTDVQKQHSESKAYRQPLYTEFYDTEKTSQLLQYFNFHHKLPKDTIQVYPTCEVGSTWVSSCYECECVGTGKHECTKINNCELDLTLYGKSSRCKPNTKFYPKSTSMPCVECTCNDEGIPNCPTDEYRNRH